MPSDGEGFGFILTKVVGLGWVKSGNPVPLEMYTPEIIARHVEQVRQRYGLVDRHIVCEVPDLVLVDDEGLTEHFRGEARLHWHYMGDVYAYGVREAIPAKGLIRTAALDLDLDCGGYTREVG